MFTQRIIGLSLIAAAAVTVAFGQSSNIQVVPQNVVFVVRVDSPPVATVPIVVAGNGAIPFQVRTSTTTGGPWLSAEKSSGTTPQLVNLIANRQGLDPGAYSGTVEVTPAGGQPVTVNAVLNVCVVPKTPLDPCFPGQAPPTSPTGALTALPSALVINVVRGPAPGVQPLTVLAGATPLDVMAQTSTKDGGSWLSVDRNVFQTPYQLQVTVAGQTMARGTYTGQVTLMAAFQSPLVIPVQMHVLDPAPPVTAIDPAFVPAPSPDTLFTITGSQFREGAQILLTMTTPQAGATTLLSPIAPTVVDSHTIRVLVPGSFLTQPGVLGVQVALPDALVSDTLKVTVGQPAPAIRSSNGIVNSSSITGGAIAPGQMVSLFGTALGPAAAEASGTIDDQGALSQQVSGVRVLFDGVPGGVLYVSDGQINAVAPNSIAGKSSTDVAVEYNGVRSAAVTTKVAPSAPGLFSLAGDGKGQVLLIHNGGVATGVLQAVTRGEVVTMYATGTGLLDHSAGDARVAPGIERPMLPVTVKVGGQNVDVLYAGTSPGMLEAVLQINIRLPETVPPGSEVPIELIAGDGHSQTGLTMLVK